LCHSRESGNPEPRHARPSLDARFRGHDTERLTRLAQCFLVYSYQPESQRVGCRRNPNSDRREISLKRAEMFRLRAIYFARELINFACDTILFRGAARKLLKSLGAKCAISQFRAISRGYAPFFSRFLFRRPFSEPPVGPSLNLVFQNSPIARIRFQGKPKRRADSEFEFRIVCDHV